MSTDYIDNFNEQLEICFDDLKNIFKADDDREKMKTEITDVFTEIITLVNDFSENPSIGNSIKGNVLNDSLTKFNNLVITYFPKNYKYKIEPIKKFYFDEHKRVYTFIKNKRDEKKKSSTVAPSPSPFAPPSTVALSAVAPSTAVAKTEVDKLTKLVEGIISGKSSLETCNDTDHTLSSFQEYLKPGVIKDSKGDKVVEFSNDAELFYKIADFDSVTRLTYRGVPQTNMIMSGNTSGFNVKRDWECVDSITSDAYKRLSPDLILACLGAFGVKTHMVDGEKQFDCNSISNEFIPDMNVLITNFCKIINSHPEILNSSLRTKYHNVSTDKWENSCKAINTVNSTTKLTPFMISRASSGSPDWKTVIKGLQAGSYVPLAITQPLPMGTLMYGRGQTGGGSQSMLFGGDAFEPQTAPKLSSDVSRILQTLLSNLKSQGIDLSDSDMKDLNNKLDAFQKAEDDLLKLSLVLSEANRLSQLPEYKSQDIMSFDQIKNANRQAELLMRKHAKMQTGFEKVIFAILQNCPP
jgi:hypothetical protein